MLGCSDFWMPLISLVHTALTVPIVAPFPFGDVLRATSKHPVHHVLSTRAALHDAFAGKILAWVYGSTMLVLGWVYSEM
jgi:hypothetical protein